MISCHYRYRYRYRHRVLGIVDWVPELSLAKDLSSLAPARDLSRLEWEGRAVRTSMPVYRDRTGLVSQIPRRSAAQDDRSVGCPGPSRVGGTAAPGRIKELSSLASARDLRRLRWARRVVRDTDLPASRRSMVNDQ